MEKSNRERIHEVEVFEAKSDFEYGFTAAKERPLLYRKLVDFSLHLISRLSSSVRSEITRVCPTIKDEELHYMWLERLMGISRAAGIELAYLKTASGFLSGFLNSGCTNFAAAPPATDDNGVYVSWNMDIMYPLRWVLGKVPLFVVRIDGRKPYVALGVPAIIALGVLNSDGLAMGANAVGMSDSGDGLNASELNNIAMETCSTVDEVGDLYTKSPRATYSGSTVTILLNANSTWGDARGGIATIEYSHNYIVVEKGKNGVLAEANHHQYLDRELSGGIDPSKQMAIAGSFARLGRMWELLEEYYGKINPVIARRIVSDHGTNYSLLEPYGIKREWHEGPIDDGTICAHYWNAWSYLKRGKVMDALTILATSCTIYQILMSPRALSIYLCTGWPCRNPHVPMYFGDLLDSKPAEPALAEGVPAPIARIKSRTERSYVGSFGWPPEPSKQELLEKFRSGVERVDRALHVT